MAEPFRDKVRRLKRLRPRVNMPVAEQNAIVDTLKSLLQQSALGSVGIQTSPSGTHIANLQPAAAGGETRFAVVRSIGTGEEHFILVEEIRQTGTNPWDGTWHIPLGSAAEPVNVYPTLLSKDYAQFIYRGTIIDRFVPVIDVHKINRQWFAFQTLKWNLPKRETSPLLRWTDCTPREDT